MVDWIWIHLVISSTSTYFHSILGRNLEGIEYKLIDFDAITRAHSIQAIFYNRFYYCSMTPHIKNCKPNSDGECFFVVSNGDTSIKYLFSYFMQVYRPSTICCRSQRFDILPGAWQRLRVSAIVWCCGADSRSATKIVRSAWWYEI